ncbi:MAG: DUF5597 domain-containing protein [Bryobacteraceae bacterium]|jgi:hypothetical protein
MKLRILFGCTLVCALALVASQCNSRSVSTAAASQIPHLQKHGTATQLIVDGKPFLVLGGELSNNGPTSVEYMRPKWSMLADAKFNTILAGVSWAQIEPAEGKFDFSAPDGIIRDARSHNLRLVLLWFASWKNSWSSYPPDWVKKDFERFPRVQIAGGKSIEVLSPFSDANRDADARAFAAFMRHVKEIDGREHTVIMIQVENEIGLPSEPGEFRDRSPLANQAYEGPVPKELMDYLQQHKDTLIPELRQVWEKAGFKTSGTWEEVFGKTTATSEIFMGWYFARYVGRVVEAGKAEYPLPMYMNTWLLEFAKANERISNSGTPMPDLFDVWHAGAPQIDIFSPDNARNFVVFCAKYTQSGNPLFIPEEESGPEGAARALYAFGHHDAIGFSRMRGGVERRTTPDTALIDMYDLLSRLAPLILEHQGTGTISAVLLNPNDPPQKVQVGNYTVEAAFARSRLTTPQEAVYGPLGNVSSPTAAAMFIAIGPDEYYAVGNGVSVTFSPNTPGPPLAGLATVEEGNLVNGRWIPVRRLAGDDTAQGQHLNLRNMGIQRFTLYRYR